MFEVAVPRAGGEDQIVVIHDQVMHKDAARLRIHANDLGHQDLGVLWFRSTLRMGAVICSGARLAVATW